MNKVAVLGTGKMGSAIARRLKSGGFDVSVWDRTRSKAEALNVGPVVDSPAEAARQADVLVTMVTGPQAMREVYFGPAGVFEGAAKRTIVDMSTVGPVAAQELADAAELKGAKLVEAPVIGSIPAVNSGTLVILAGAAVVEDLETVRPVLQQLGEVHYVGDIVSAAALKLIANSFLGIVSAGAAELMAAGRAQGLDAQQIFTLLSRVAPGLKVREAGFVRNIYEPPMFAVRDILKDLDLALALYQRAPGVHSRVPLTAMTRELFGEVAARVPEPRHLGGPHGVFNRPDCAGQGAGIMTLLTRPLGRSGLKITQVGFGAWAIGGGGWAYGWGSQDDADSIAAIKHAVASGINWVDTAAIYGLGHSEEVVGRAVREIPAAERPYVFTKGGMIPDRSQPFKEPERNLRPDSIRREVEASLRRLGVERIDLYQFHWPDAIGTPIEESWGEMARLIDEGKVRAGGVSNFNVELLWRAERVHHVDSLQPPFSLIHRQSGADVIPWSTAHGTGVIVYSPMQSGILTDAFSRERVERMAADDWRRRGVEFQEPQLTRNLALRDALQPIASRYGVSVAAVAVAWTLSWPGVSGAIVGARSPEQVDGWIRAGRLTLDAADLAEIASALDRTQAGSGPTQPAVVDDGRGRWLEHGLDPSSLEGAITRMVLPANR